MFRFWSLNEDVLSNVLSEWTDIRDLVFLDSAMCKIARHYLFQIFKGKAFIHIGQVTSCSEEYYRWLSLKNIRIRNINLLHYNDKPLGEHVIELLRNQKVLKHLLMRNCHNLREILDKYCCNILAMKFHNNPDLTDMQLSTVLSKFGSDFKTILVFVAARI